MMPLCVQKSLLIVTPMRVDIEAAAPPVTRGGAMSVDNPKVRSPLRSKSSV